MGYGNMAGMQGIFKDLASNRAERNRRFAIYGFTVKGTRYKTPSAFAASADEAQRTVERMTELNPGKRYVYEAIPQY